MADTSLSHGVLPAATGTSDAAAALQSFLGLSYCLYY